MSKVIAQLNTTQVDATIVDCGVSVTVASNTTQANIISGISQAQLDKKLNISDFNLDSFDTDDLSEGVTNLYDKTVVLNAGSNVTIAGAYPNFTINATGGVPPVTSVNSETGDVVLTTGDIAADTDFNYVSDAQLAVINDTSGVNTGDQNLSDYALTAEISAVGLSNNYNELDNLPTLGTAAATAATDYATSAQGNAADTALQPLDNISELTNDSGYITDLSSFDTDDLGEGVANQYFTDARAQAAVNLTPYALLSGATFTGDIEAPNLSGTNTGDQDIKPIEVTVTTARTTAAKVGTTAGGSYVPAAGDRLDVTFTLGVSVNTPTLNIDGSGAINIRLGTTNVGTTLLSTAAASVVVPLFFDGTFYQMLGSQLNTNTTYTEITEAEITDGTAATLRTITGRRAQAIVDKANAALVNYTPTVDLGDAAFEDIVPITMGGFGRDTVGLANQIPQVNATTDGFDYNFAMNQSLQTVDSPQFVNGTFTGNLSALNLSGTNTGDQNLSGLVPYTGATADVDLGTFKLTSGNYQTILGDADDLAFIGKNNTYTDFAGTPITTGGGNVIVTGHDNITKFSAALATFGIGNSAQGNNAVALGISNQAGTLFNSGGVAVGFQNTAAQNTDTSVGFSNFTSGTANNSAIGYDNTASNGASAIGSLNTASILGSSSVGFTNTSNNGGSAVGRNNNAPALNSSALGVQNEASGSSSVAVGFANTADQTDSICIGRQNQGFGFNIGRQNNTTGNTSSVGAIGFNNTGTGLSIGFGNNSGLNNSSFAIGGSNTCSGAASYAIGLQCTSSAQLAGSMGYFSTATGLFSFSCGLGANATNTLAMAYGYVANASGDNSVSVGNTTTASGANSVSVGKNLTASAANTAVFGWASSVVDNTTANTQEIVYTSANRISMSATRTAFNLPIIGTGLSMGYVAKTAAYTTLAGDHTIDCTSGTFTVTLLTAVGNAGKIYVIKNSGTGVITIDAAGAELIDGALTQVLNVQYQSLTLQSTGAGWIIV